MIKKKGASTVRRRFGFATARTTASGVTRGVAYLDDGVQELLGLAAGLDDVVAVGVRVVVGVVRAFASVPLRMGVSGQGRTRRSGSAFPRPVGMLRIARNAGDGPARRRPPPCRPAASA
jgi:hypothetical protein